MEIPRSYQSAGDRYGDCIPLMFGCRALLCFCQGCVFWHVILVLEFFERSFTDGWS